MEDAAAPSDASTDGTLGDVGVADTSTDAPTDARTEAGVPFCAPYLDAGPGTFCQDFDSIGDASMLGASASPGVDVALDTSDFVSPPASLRITMPAADAGALHGSVTHAMTIAPTTVTLDFDLKVTAAASSSANVASLGFSSGFRALIVVVVSSGLYLEENAPPPDGGANVLFNHPKISVTWGSSWHHVQVVLSLASKTSTVVLDGTPRETNFALEGNWVTGTVNFTYGVSYTATGPWDLAQDNVLLQLAP